jgi:hypothetical protein
LASRLDLQHTQARDVKGKVKVRFRHDPIARTSTVFGIAQNLTCSINCFTANPENPAAAEVSLVCDELIVAIQDARKGPRDLRNRIDSEGARTARKASLLIQARVEEEWKPKGSIKESLAYPRDIFGLYRPIGLCFRARAQPSLGEFGA